MTEEITVYASRSIPADVRAAVIARDGMVCRHCGRRVVRRSTRLPYQPDTLHIDHTHHWAAGGSDEPDNLVVSCADCNLRRPKPATVVRQNKVRVRRQSGTYYWPDDYRPPLVTNAPERSLWSVRTFASIVGVTEAQVFLMIHRGHLAATAKSPVRVEIPECLRNAPAAGLEAQRQAVRADRQRRARQRATECRLPFDEATSKARWARIIEQRRARERTKREASQ